ncbi:hypothetical protein ACUXVT_06020 [Acinetobacter soli]|uniref:hypothetical protein n=1 Tax=Acinetobacter soli TaxID=487316 RepID=UPI004057C807
MNNEIKNFLINTFGLIIVIGIIFFFLIYYLLYEVKATTALQDTITLIIALLSVLTTSGAAIIAARLFNRWEDSQTGINKSDLSKNLMSSMCKLISYLEFYNQKASIQFKLYKIEISPEMANSFLKSLESIPEESQKLRANFHKDLEVHTQQFEIDLKMYEKTFNQEFKLDLGEIDCYRAAIGGMLRDLGESQPVNKIELIMKHMKFCEKNCNYAVFDPLMSELRKNINIKEEVN